MACIYEHIAARDLGGRHPPRLPQAQYLFLWHAACNRHRRLAGEEMTAAVVVRLRMDAELQFRLGFAMGKIRGTRRMRRHISVHRPLPDIFLTRLFSNLRLKRKDFQKIVRLPWARTERLQ